jgi:hypothetical protein
MQPPERAGAKTLLTAPPITVTIEGAVGMLTLTRETGSVRDETREPFDRRLSDLFDRALDELLRREMSSIELLHACALILDDVMDESPLRRGRTTARLALAERHRELGWAGSSRRFGESAPLHLGHAIAGGEPGLRRVLSAYALPLGAAFQLRDDVLGVFGVFGDPARTGPAASPDQAGRAASSCPAPLAGPAPRAGPAEPAAGGAG